MPETETEHDSKNDIEGLGELWKIRLAFYMARKSAAESKDDLASPPSPCITPPPKFDWEENMLLPAFPYFWFNH